LQKRFLLNFLGLLLLVVVFITVKAEVAKAYGACRKKMLSFEASGVWVYQHTRVDLFLKPSLIFDFNDGYNDASCLAYRGLTGWHWERVTELLPTCLECPEGYFGVSP
jgi:hypothetical protein